MSEDFEQEHKDEIERMAFKIYQDRLRYGQEDNSHANWCKACELVRERYAATPLQY